MAVITNLANTTWVFHELLELPTTDQNFDLNFTCDQFPGTQFSRIFFHMNEEQGDVLVYTNSEEWNSIVYDENTGWNPDGARYITITGGAGATDSDTITFITNNANRITIPDAFRKIMAPFTNGQKLYLGSYTGRVLYDGNVAQYEDKSNLTEILDYLASISDGALGKLTDGGYFAPTDREPRSVGPYSLLVTDAKGMDMESNRSLAIVSGLGISIQNAAAGSTVYYMTNNYVNRIVAKTCENGYVSKDEATSTQELIVPVISVKINGQSFTPDSSPDNSSSPIAITVASTVNPDEQINKLRLFGVMKSYATAHIGNGVHTEGGGRNLLVGGGVTKQGTGNDVCMVGQQMYCDGLSNAAFGRNHIIRKNRGFFAGTGHDSTNARAEGAAAVGLYSYMDINTLFAVGNGTSHTDRSNAFEVVDDGVVLRDTVNGNRYKLSVTNGSLNVTAV